MTLDAHICTETVGDPKEPGFFTQKIIEFEAAFKHACCRQTRDVFLVCTPAQVHLVVYRSLENLPRYCRTRFPHEMLSPSNVVSDGQSPTWSWAGAIHERHLFFLLEQASVPSAPAGSPALDARPMHYSPSKQHLDLFAVWSVLDTRDLLHRFANRSTAILT